MSLNIKTLKNGLLRMPDLLLRMLPDLQRLPDLLLLLLNGRQLLTWMRKRTWMQMLPYLLLLLLNGLLKRYEMLLLRRNELLHDSVLLTMNVNVNEMRNDFDEFSFYIYISQKKFYLRYFFLNY